MVLNCDFAVIFSFILANYWSYNKAFSSANYKVNTSYHSSGFFLFFIFGMSFCRATPLVRFPFHTKKNKKTSKCAE